MLFTSCWTGGGRRQEKGRAALWSHWRPRPPMLKKGFLVEICSLVIIHLVDKEMLTSYLWLPPSWIEITLVTQCSWCRQPIRVQVSSSGVHSNQSDRRTGKPVLSSDCVILFANESGPQELCFQSNPVPCRSVRAYQSARSFQVGRCSCFRSLVQHCRLDLRPRGIYFQRTRQRNQDGWQESVSTLIIARPFINAFKLLRLELEQLQNSHKMPVMIMQIWLLGFVYGFLGIQRAKIVQLKLSTKFLSPPLWESR